MSKILFEAPKNWVPIRVQDYARFNIVENLEGTKCLSAFAFAIEPKSAGLVALYEIPSEEGQTLDDIIPALEEVQDDANFIKQTNEFKQEFFSQLSNVSSLKFPFYEKLLINNIKAVISIGEVLGEQNKKTQGINLAFELNKTLYSFTVALVFDDYNVSTNEMIKASNILTDFENLFKTIKTV